MLVFAKYVVSMTRISAGSQLHMHNLDAKNINLYQVIITSV